MNKLDAQADAVVRFWQDAGPTMWFAKDEAFDTEFHSRFLALHMAAARREYEHWLSDPYSSLALILLLDQFPRNSFRGTGHMYATDPLARHYAHRMIEADFIDKVLHELQVFACLPFSHSENMDDQIYAVELYKKYALDGMEWAIVHRDIIQKFGRFPHRNVELARVTTPDEQRFLDEGGFSG